MQSRIRSKAASIYKNITHYRNIWSTRNYLKNCEIPIPPENMRNKVRKGATHEADFVFEGKQVYNELISILGSNNININKPLKIYEFGCGCGRVARYFMHKTNIEFYGTDIDKELIHWCQNNLVFGEFHTNDYMPPLIYKSEYFDFVYSISVFTHLTLDAQRKWFEELHRITKSDGFIVVSIIEKNPKQLRSGVKVDERQDTNIKREWLGKESCPSIYYTAYHTIEYLRNEYADLFEIVDTKSRAIRKKQTLLLLRPIRKKGVY